MKIHLEPLDLGLVKDGKHPHIDASDSTQYLACIDGHFWAGQFFLSHSSKDHYLSCGTSGEDKEADDFFFADGEWTGLWKINL